MEKKVIRLTESDLIRLVNRVIKEESESPKLKHRLGWRTGGGEDAWYDEDDRQVKNSEDFDDYDEEMEFGPDDYEEFTNQTKGFENRWNPAGSKRYYDHYTKKAPLRIRRKSY